MYKRYLCTFVRIVCEMPRVARGTSEVRITLEIRANMQQYSVPFIYKVRAWMTDVTQLLRNLRSYVCAAWSD